MTQQEIIQQKILPPETLDRRLVYWRFKNQKIVFTNGCFDILHAGHFDYLSRAADLGDVLIIGLNTDESVKRLKGENRPINPETARAFALASLSFVTAVVLFSEDTPLELIRKIKPDILVKGNDYSPEQIVGYDVVTSYGGQVVTLPLVQGFSTTGIIQKITSFVKT